MLNNMLVDYIKREDMIEGEEYYCSARNFTVGKWNGVAFEYLRSKMGGTFMDTELHWDDGVPHGTAKPLSRWKLTEV